VVSWEEERELIVKAVEYSVWARWYALAAARAYARAALVLKLSYLIELADALLAGDAKRAAALARLFELAEFDLYMDTFQVGVGCIGVEKPLGRTYALLGQLALEAERRGARELAEYLRVRAKLQLLTGEALHLLFGIATRDYHASFTDVSALLAPWASWDEWMYSEEACEWKNRVSQELMRAALAEALGRAPPNRVRELLRRYAEELAAHVRSVWRPLPRAVNPILKADAEAARLLEEVGKLRYLERAEELEREIAMGKAR
jgi:hypothetical protein